MRDFVLMESDDMALAVGPFISPTIAEAWAKENDNDKWYYCGPVYLTDPEVAQGVMGA